MKKRYLLLIGVLVAAGACAAWYFRDTTDAETEKIAAILDWKAGQNIGEIGAGEGRMTFAAARAVGPSGHVYSNEIDSRRLAKIAAGAKQRNLTNVTVIQGGETETNLPPDCCDSVFMRDVYHHFTHPEEIDASLFRAVRPGGLLAVIDFTPNALLSIIAPVRGAPLNRGRHGIPKEILIGELKHAVFEMVSIPNDFPGRNYCIVFRRPLSSR
ncbi:MAG: hypothetical protein DMG59_03840 [Acidobacteria bacterium]|nr:MAG: hypothetical protein DMG59_03840 [Acidobacteriota bacterium]